MSAIPFKVDILDTCNDLALWTKVNNTTGRDVEESTLYTKFSDRSFRFYDTTRSSNIMAEKAIAHTFMPRDGIGIVSYAHTPALGDSTWLMTQGSDNATFASGNRWQRLAAGHFEASRGWSLFPITFGSTTVPGGSPTVNLAYVGLRVGLSATASLDRECFIDSIIRYRSRPCVLISLDDGTVTSYSVGHAAASARGIPLAHFVDPAAIGSSATYLTRAQLREMLAAGDVIGAHNNVTGVWDTSPNQIPADFAAVGMLTGERCLHGSYPNGRYGQAAATHDLVQEALEAIDARSCRTIANNLLFPGVYSPLYLPGGINLNTDTSLAAATARVDYAIQYGLTATFYGHKFAVAEDSTTWATSKWHGLLDHIAARRKQGLIDTPSLDEWFVGRAAA